MLSSYPNVFNTCLVLLKRAGYRVGFVRDRDEWTAEKDGYEFLADNPIELLGPTSIYERIAPKEPTEYWWKLDEPNILGELDPG